MLRKISLIAVVISLLAFGGVSMAVTLDEAKAKVEKEATERNLTSADKSQAVTTLQGLVEKGVPVEHAYNVVDASINKGIKGKELSNIARSIESVPSEAKDEAATVATAAIAHNYKSTDVVKTVEAVNIAVKDGAKPEATAEVVTKGIDKGLSGNDIKKTAKNYGTDIKKGVSQEKAMEHASMSMEMEKNRDRNRDRDMSRDREKMDSGSGMGHGSGKGMDSGMGHGSGKGMGGGSGMGGRR